MRADERLLEVIVEQCQIVGQELALGNDSNRATAEKALREIGMAAGEMRRRGDTLVRRDDLRKAVEAMEWVEKRIASEPNAVRIAATERLNIALGGKLR
jgi:hypothetical protein